LKVFYALDNIMHVTLVHSAQQRCVAWYRAI